jgi:hypothetical protein
MREGKLMPPVVLQPALACICSTLSVLQQMPTPTSSGWSARLSHYRFDHKPLVL